jgi:DNA-binding transcriptional LysR family regulator
MARFPQIDADVNMSDRPVDVVGDGFDLAVRIRELPDSSLKTRRLGELRTVVYGAPDYFKRHGRPRQPSDLADHQCILRRTAQGEADAWRFRIDGRLTTVQVNGRFRTDSTTAAHAAARHGIGVGYGPFWQIRDLVDQEALEIVLEDFEAPRTPVRAVFPPSAIPPAKTHLFVDLLAERLKLERL